MHDKTIEVGLVSAPAVHVTEDEYQVLVLVPLVSRHSVSHL